MKVTTPTAPVTAKASTTTRPAATTSTAAVSKDGFGSPAQNFQSVAATPVASAPSSNGPAPLTYTVKPGDTYWGLAIRFGTYAPVIGEANGDPSMTKMKPGETITIPGETSYTVQAGDTLSALASQYETTVAALAKTNNIKNPDEIMVGQKLAVPDLGGSDATALSQAVASQWGLGKLVTSQGAAGTLYFQYAKGTVEFSNVTGKITGVTLGQIGTPGATQVPGRVVDTAMYGLLGPYQGSQGAAGHLYYQFGRAAVNWSNVENKVLNVTWPNGKTTPPDQDVY